jgi:hypothetical protein
MEEAYIFETSSYLFLRLVNAFSSPVDALNVLVLIVKELYASLVLRNLQYFINLLLTF